MNTKMKALSLALMAISGLALAGTAAAACPAGPTVAEGGAWSAKSTLGGSLAITSPGFAGTECKLDAAIVTTGPGTATVRDNTPSAEPRYRAQFIVNVDALSGMNTVQSVGLFGAWTETPHASRSELVRLTVTGNLQGTAKNLNIFTVSEGAPDNMVSASHALSAGENTIEIDWDKASGSLKVWVNNGTEGSPDVNVAANNAGWSGVDYATLGLANASSPYRANQINELVSFDEFDSRRVSFIGL